MASMPPAMNAPMPTQMPGMEPAQVDQGYCIKIAALPDGTFSVSSKPLEEPEEPGGKTVRSIGEALKAALDIFKNSGKSDGGQADFAEGYGKPDPTVPPIKERVEL